MLFRYEGKVRNTLIAMLFAAPFLLGSTIFSGDLFDTNLSSIAFGASDTPFFSDQRLIPADANYQVLDPGNVDLTGAVSLHSVNAPNTDYPAPDLRGYPAPRPFKRIQINSNAKKELMAILDAINAYFDIEAGTTDGDAEIQLYKLLAISSQVKYRVVGDAFLLQFVDENGEIITKFNKPIRITFRLSVAGASTNNNSDSVIKPYQWSQSEGTWKGLEYEYNSDENSISANITGSGEIALLRNVQVYVPSIH